MAAFKYFTALQCNDDPLARRVTRMTLYQLTVLGTLRAGKEVRKPEDPTHLRRLELDELEERGYITPHLHSTTLKFYYLLTPAGPAALKAADRTRLGP